MKEKLANIEENANNYVLPSDVVKDANYVHTDNNFTTIEKNKLSRILNGSQNITEEDMNKMSKAVGKNISYFLREDFMPEKIIVDYNSISLCADKIDKEQLQTVDKIRSLLISADIVLGSEDRFMGIKL